ncbi:class I SAM-dependent methyltransferase [Mangrovimicrobium sediminis]|uniref:Class I SAM-dependent methyltransferase n=1 Tax=Mangrovimicrobium sediminis TaxID=2562682 RepID=A0A4Z0M7L9_9GAMM|nr:class I SAM-dependent methyltransferase [Haliea sp. SAOS-164]TGD75672.1 class I SAM-dependent methyltransferase [Haliea sp. SAOS-164]
MQREYQFNYSEIRPSVFDSDGRSRKAETIVRVCRDFLQTEDLSSLTLLDVGSSSGIIDNYLADHFGEVFGIDIDEPAMAFARERFDKPNLHFAVGDAMQLERGDNSVDVVVCSHVYEHVPDAAVLFAEIFRVLRPGGFCYFSGNNRVMLMEPHYRLPLLSLLPRPLAHLYMRAAGKGRYYHEKHLSYTGLRRLCAGFELHDYSPRVISEPEKFGVEYMLRPGSLKWRLASTVARYCKWATPHIWLLRKPAA